MKIDLYRCDHIKLPLGNGDFLRPLQEQDVTPQYVGGLNDSDVNKFLTGPKQQWQTMDTVKSFVCTNRDADDGLLFGLFVGGELRGTTRLHDITQEQAYLGLALFDKSIWGKGWGRRVIVAVTEFARKDLRIKKIVAGIEDENIASQKAFAAAGYQIRTDEHKVTEKSGAQFWTYTL